MSDLQPLVARATAGDPQATSELFALLYRELHGLAAAQLRRNGDHVTLGATTLLHEAWLHLSRREDLAFPDRAHFFGYAARSMRGLLIDYLRSRKAAKRGGEFHLTTVSESLDASPTQGTRFDDLNTALEELAAIDAPLAQLVDLHFFCGFTFDEIAAMRDVSVRTVMRDWRKARLLLNRLLDPES